MERNSPNVLREDADDRRVSRRRVLKVTGALIGATAMTHMSWGRSQQTEGEKSQMIKMTMLLKRNPKLTHEQFVEHHIQKHGPLFKSIPEAQQHVLRYIQTHPIQETTTVVTVNDYDGTAEIWFDSLAGLEAVLTSPTYKAKVFPDEITFLDHKNTLVTIGKQVEIVGDYVEGAKSVTTL